MTKRVLFDLLILVSIIYLPWWTMLLFVACGAFVFDFYVEALAFGIIFDLMYGTIDSSMYGIGIFVVCTALFFIMPCVKDSVR